MDRKGQAVFAWVFGIVALFALITVFYIFIPVVQDIGDTVHNLSVESGAPSVPNVNEAIEITRTALPLGIFVLVVGVILYMVAAMQKEEDHTDITYI